MTVNHLRSSKTLLGILADLDNALVWMALILSLISNSSCPFSKALGSIPSTLTTIDITINLMFKSLLLLLLVVVVVVAFAFAYFFIIILLLASISQHH